MPDDTGSSRSKLLFVIDDDDDLRFTMGLALRDAGFDVRELASADEALQAASSSRPGAIFLDYHIEGTTAEELVDALRARGLGGVPVLLLTGSADIREIAARIGVFGWLAKPFELDDLVDRATKALAAAPG
jgi:DNA-binding NtrC family response regulator